MRIKKQSNIKAIFLTLISISVFCTLNSQNTKLGLRVNSSMSKLTGDYQLFSHSKKNTDNQFVINFGSGVFVNFSIKNNFSIQPEFNYKIKGFEYSQKPDLVGARWWGKAKFDYLEFPILINYSFGKMRKGFINIGPSVNFLLDGGNYNYSRWGSQAGGIGNKYSSNIKLDFTPITAGIVGGFGVQLVDLSKCEIITELRFSYDFSNSTKKKEFIDQNTGESWFYHNSHFLDFSLNFGFVYKLSNKMKL